MTSDYSRQQRSSFDRIEFLFPKFFHYYIVMLHILYLFFTLLLVAHLFFSQQMDGDLYLALSIGYVLSAYLFIRYLFCPISFQFMTGKKLLKVQFGLFSLSNTETVSYDRLKYLYIKIKNRKHNKMIYLVKVIDQNLRHLTLYHSGNWEDVNDYMNDLAELTKIECLHDSEIRFIKEGDQIKYEPLGSLVLRSLKTLLFFFGGFLLCYFISFNVMQENQLLVTMLLYVLFLPGVYVLQDGTPSALH